MDLISEIKAEFGTKKAFAEASGMKAKQVQQWGASVPAGRVAQVERFLAIWRENRRLSAALDAERAAKTTADPR